MHLTLTRRLATLAATGSVIIPMYAAIGVYTAKAGGPLYTVPTVVDHLVPFDPRWVVVYALVFLQALAPLAVVSDTRALHRTVAAYGTMYLLATPIWLLYPVTVPRPAVPIVDLWTYGLGIVRFVDPPTNCMPSMHVGLAALASFITWRHDRAAGVGLGITTALIWWSTMAVHQHWATDGLVATALAFLADRLCFGLAPLPEEALTPMPRAWHLAWLGLYVVGVLVLMSGWWLGWVPVDKLPPNAPSW